MWKSIAGWVSHQVRSERNKLLAAGELPFCELLPASYVERVLDDESVQWRDCVYSPLVTLADLVRGSFLPAGRGPAASLLDGAWPMSLCRRDGALLQGTPEAPGEGLCSLGPRGGRRVARAGQRS
jgi:hypothetical protein